jgi:chemotaxis protein CheX
MWRDYGRKERVPEDRYINPFVVGTQFVFKTMFDIELFQGQPSAKTDRKTTADVTGVMSFTGDRRGTMTFSASVPGALAIYARLLGENFNRLTVGIMDAVGEITNIISGQARKELDKEGLHLTAHAPMVLIPERE